MLEYSQKIITFMSKNTSNIDLSQYKAFLFDLDGTVLDGSDRHFVQCVLETGRDFGKNIIISPGTALKQFLRKNFGMGDEELIKFYDRNKERMITTPRPVAFHQDVLAFIAEYSSVPRAIVTNCHDWELALTENSLNLREVFPTVIYKLGDIPGKPAPDLYFQAAKTLKVVPSDCLVFEDSATGIAAGKNAGMTVIGIDRGTHHDFADADLVVASLLELLPNL